MLAHAVSMSLTPHLLKICMRMHACLYIPTAACLGVWGVHAQGLNPSHFWAAESIRAELGVGKGSL